MKRLFVGTLVALGLVGAGLFVGMKQGVSNNDVQAVQCEVSEASGYVYEETMPTCLPVHYMETFEEHIWNMYVEEYCVNYCEECDSYYYAECMCDSCANDCVGCLEVDYELFIADNYDMIMDIHDELLIGIQEDYMDRETELVIYEF